MDKTVRELIPQAGPKDRYHYMTLPLSPGEIPLPEQLAKLAVDAFGHLDEATQRLSGAEISVETIQGQPMLMLTMRRWPSDPKDEDNGV